MIHAEPAAHRMPATALPAQSIAARLGIVAAPALLALASLIVYALAVPLAPRLALVLHLGAVAARGNGFALGWLTHVALYAADAAAGSAGATTLGALALFGLVAFVFARARLRAGTTLALGAALFALFTCFDAARLGGGAPAWLGAAAYLYALERSPRRSAWFAPAIALVWCNACAAGVLAPVLAVLFAFGRIFATREVTAGRPYWPLALASAVALLLTPAGFGYPAQALAALHFDEQFGRVLPIAPAVGAPHVYRLATTLVLLGAAWLWAGRKRAVDAPLVLAAFGLCFFDGAFVPLLGIVAGPAFAAAASAGDERIAAPRRGEAFAALAAACFVVLAGLAALPHAPLQAATNAAPRALFDRLAASGGPHVVLCGTVAWCDYAETYPGLRPFVDERVELATLAQLRAQEKIGRARAGWHEALRAGHVDALIVSTNAAIAQLAPAMRGWRRVAADGEATLFVRDGSTR